MAACCGSDGMAKRMFEVLLEDYYAGKSSIRQPWTKERVAQVIQYIKGGNLAFEIGKKKSPAEHYFCKFYDVLLVDDVERVIAKKTREDGSVRIVLPKEQYFDTMQLYHDKLGHVGLDSLSNAVLQRFVLPRHVLSMFISCCNVCNDTTPRSGVKVTRRKKAGVKRTLRKNANTSTFTNCATQNQNSLQEHGRTSDSASEIVPLGDYNVMQDNDAFMHYLLKVPQAASSTQKQASSPQQPPPQPQKLVPPSQVSAPKPIAPKPTVAPVTPLQPLPPPPEVCLRWNSYHSNMQATFPSLLNNEQFVDVTLACEGRSIKCHKMMLSACSAYFEELLSQNPCQHPIVLMKDLKYWEVQALVDFMYRGEVNVAQDKLPSLLAAAEALQIKGLAGPAFASHDEESVQSSVPLSSAEDYLDESTPSPSSARRARKRRVMTSVASPRPQTVQSPQIPMSTPRNASGKRTARPSLSIPSTSNYQHESSSLPSEPPVRRQRKSEAGEIMGEIKIEPIDIEISNDSMDQMDDNFMDKPYEDTDVGDGGESSCQGDDPGGTKDQKSSSENSKLNIHRQDLDQMDYGTNGTPGNDQNFRYEDNTSHDGMSIVPDLPGTSYQESIPQPSSSGANSGNITDSLMGHL